MNRKLLMAGIACLGLYGPVCQAQTAAQLAEFCRRAPQMLSQCTPPSTDLSSVDMKVVQASLIGMKSSNWQIRDDAFDALRKAYQDKVMPPSIQNAVIKALILRNTEKVHTPDTGDGEAFGEGLADYLEVVGSFGTPEAAYALLDHDLIQTGGIATRGIAAAGPMVVQPVLKRFDEIPTPIEQGSEVVGYALSLIHVMTSLVTAGQINALQRAAIEQRIMAASASHDATLRAVAIEGLKALGDDAARARLAEIAKSDPWVASLPPRRDFYPVREDAEKALAASRPR